MHYQAASDLPDSQAAVHREFCQRRCVEPEHRRAIPDPIDNNCCYLAYYYDHFDELQEPWDGSRRRDFSRKPRAIKCDFDEGIFEREIPLHPASREIEESVDPLDKTFSTSDPSGRADDDGGASLDQRACELVEVQCGNKRPRG